MVLQERVILLTNDDGVEADGIRELRRLASALGECYVVAPEVEMSGVSHALTLHDSVRSRVVAPRTHAVKGTPVDCILLGVESILEKRPSCILSGINHGYNLGRDTSYSGTVAAALEGTCLRIPSIALSAPREPCFPLEEHTASLITSLVRRVMLSGLPQGVCLNVNIPPGRARGIKLAPLGFDGMHVKVVEERSKGDGRILTFSGWRGDTLGQRGQVDSAVLAKGWIAVTPVRVDRTAMDCAEAISDMETAGGRD